MLLVSFPLELSIPDIKIKSGAALGVRGSTQHVDKRLGLDGALGNYPLHSVECSTADKVS